MDYSLKLSLFFSTYVFKNIQKNNYFINKDIIDIDQFEQGWKCVKTLGITELFNNTVMIGEIYRKNNTQTLEN